MPPLGPGQQSLAARLWLSRRFGSGSAAASARGMNIESLEHLLRNRVRLFLRHTWLVTILGTLVLGSMFWFGFYMLTRADHMRIAADAADAKFVQALTTEIGKGHHDLSLRLIRTANAEATTEAM